MIGYLPNKYLHWVWAARNHLLFLLPESVSWTSGSVRYMLLCFLIGTASVTLLAFSESLQGDDRSNNVIDGYLWKAHGMRPTK